MMRGLMPWMKLGRREMDRLLNRLAETKWDEARCPWLPRADLSETIDSLIVRVETAGMDRADIQVSLREKELTIRGEHEQEENEEAGGRYHRVERCCGAFTRSIWLPVAVDAGKVTATFKNGLLTVILPKMPAAKGTTIAIKGE